MSSSIVRQLVATVGFVGMAVLVGMPVRAQQVVLTPAGMQMVVPIAPPAVQAQNNMTMEELLKNSPRMEGTENLPDFWTKPGAPIVSPPSDYVQKVGSLGPNNFSPTEISSISVKVEPIAGLKDNYVPAEVLTKEEMENRGYASTFSAAQNLSGPSTSDQNSSPLSDSTANYQLPAYTGQPADHSASSSSLINSRVFPWSGY